MSSWATMRKYNISANLVHIFEQLYNKATNAVQMNGSIGEWFNNNSQSKATMSSVTHPLQHFLDRIMSDALEEHDGKVSTGGRNISICVLLMT